eukprot:CAMPEP_0194203214 /NCGR_PEP_ID=MMETSP0156-20130528/3059_1 /TAXON_ID=33649 /ORGANISM="Thalassionema nitzschioides, Strain L26-B" /LENGTH=119 /DNA_ID=CAMNT_0038928919 /DNA_START=56 /DNA_END=415 /DNA_ORIENTATION=-
MTTENNEKSITEETDNASMEMETKELSEAQEGADEPQFVNQGFLKWEESRNKWISSTQESNSKTKTGAKALDVDEIIDLIFSQRWRSQSPERNQFPEAVPLPQMVDILVDLWEAEGLDI